MKTKRMMYCWMTLTLLLFFSSFSKSCLEIVPFSYPECTQVITGTPRMLLLSKFYNAFSLLHSETSPATQGGNQKEAETAVSVVFSGTRTVDACIMGSN